MNSKCKLNDIQIKDIQTGLTNNEKMFPPVHSRGRNNGLQNSDDMITCRQGKGCVLADATLEARAGATAGTRSSWN